MALPPSEYVSDIWKVGIFNNKVVFCTGGSGSICSAQVRALVYLGANACIVGRNIEKAERVAKNIATARDGAVVLGVGSVDVRNVASLQSAVEKVCKRARRHRLCDSRCCWQFPRSDPVTIAERFQVCVDIDVLGSYNIAKVTLPYVVASAAQHKTGGQKASTGTGSRIVFVSATYFQTGLPLQTHVAVAKFAVNAWSNNLAIEMGPLGVTSNIIAPGPIGASEGMNRLTPASDADKDGSSRIPLGKQGSVKDIADATVYLFSDAANYVNGDVLIVDGGAWHTMGGAPGHTVPYPDFLLSNEVVGAARAGARSKL